MLLDQITEDMKNAMRAKDALRLSTIRMLLAAIKQREIDERCDSDDAAVLSIVTKMVKQRQDAQTQFANAGRTDLAEKEAAEITILQDYLPEMLSNEEIKSLIQNAISNTQASSMKDMGSVMQAVKPHLEHRADMRVVSQLIKEQLQG